TSQDASGYQRTSYDGNFAAQASLKLVSDSLLHANRDLRSICRTSYLANPGEILKRARIGKAFCEYLADRGLRSFRGRGHCPIGTYVTILIATENTKCCQCVVL